VPARTVSRVKVGGRTLELSNLDKVMYPKTGFTKAQVIDYYARIAPAMVPHTKDRPLNLKRYPHGVEQAFFFQKEAPAGTPEWLRTYDVWSDTNQDTIHFTTASDTASLVWLANLANLEFHTLLCHGKDPETPTMMVFDLDPGEGVGLLESAAVSLLVKDHLQDMGLKSFPKVSGGKGVQPYVPLNTPCTFTQTRDASLAVARALERRHPEAIVTNMRKDLRKGKVLIDYSQNSRHKSTVCVYSLRAREKPSVSAPLEWSEVEKAVDDRSDKGLRFSPEEVLRRVERKGDLFAPVEKLKQRLPGREAPEQPRPVKRTSKRPAKKAKAAAKPVAKSRAKARDTSKKATGVRTAWAPRPKAR